MVIQRRTVAQFEDLISNGVASRDETIDTYIGPIRDLFITPPAEVMKGIHDNIVYLSQLMSMQNAGTFNPEDLDAFVYNENIIRWNGSPSYAVVTFSRLLPPTADITIPMNFPLATKTDPKTGQIVNFRTIETKTMYGPLTVSPSSYYNVQTSRYEIDVAVVSVIAGGNVGVGAYTITQFRRSFPDFEYVTNKSATTTGRGLETNTDLAVRYQTRITGNQEATPAGLKSFSLNLLSNIEDVYVVYGNDPNLERQAEDAGANDVWIKSASPATDTYNTYYRGVRELIPLPKQPLMTITSVSSGATYYTEGVDFEAATGEGIYAYSDRGKDGIRFLIGGAAPALNAPLQIVYSYNAMINIVTALYKQPESFVMGSDTIFRWAQRKNLTIEAQLKVGSGNPTTILAAVRDRVLTYINSLKLGADVEEFDIDAQVAQISGVDNWVYVTLAVKGGIGVGDIAVGPMEYAFIEDADLIISLI
jgi:hypothetical protein